ncbi:hypothetical protein DL96DRAFT_1757948 [Flagelloscypha sp. PMI_526]|nr:hypothetical protein DL96DRAFT_1757948 [Flagelloscypha sp. PMI_526]
MRIDFTDEFMWSANQYRNEVDKTMKSPSNKPGNTTYLFHGTRVMCQIGYQSNYNQTCADSRCSLCCIIRYSFSLDFAGSATQFKRFGNGLYFSSISSKCDDYVRVPRSGNRTDSLRVLIIANVVLGTVWATKDNIPHLKGPPPGFHSVMGKPGKALNFEEHVVYDNRAVQPAYIVVYQ